MAGLSQSYDVLNRIVIDVTICPNRTEELSMSASHLRHLQKNLLLKDRAYASFKFFYQIQIDDNHFVIRMK